MSPKERKHDDEHIDFNNAPRELHRLARDWHILIQDCRDLFTQLEFLRKTYRKYVETLLKAGWALDASNAAGSFDVLLSEAENLTRWTMVYRDRTNLRINLVSFVFSWKEDFEQTYRLWGKFQTCISFHFCFGGFMIERMSEGLTLPISFFILQPSENPALILPLHPRQPRSRNRHSAIRRQ